MRTSTKYFLLGAGFGILFPLISTLLAVYHRGLSLNWAHIVEVQMQEPLLWVIDTAPLFLGLFALVAGMYHEKLEQSSKATSTDLEHLFRISRDFLCVLDEKGSIQRCNLAFETVCGKSDTALHDHALAEMVHPEDRQGMRDILEKAAQGEEDTSFENRVVAADGRSLQVQWSISMQVEGKVLAIGRDVTKSRQAEAKLSSYAKNLERSLDELDQFAYVVSHDLKTPLRGIYSLADFIEEDLEAGDRKAVGEHLDLLKNRVDRMQNLIMGVLAYSRAGKDLNERRPIPLGHFLQDVIDSMAIPEGFSVHFPSELPTVRFNPTKLQQVLQNLLSNACKYNGSDSGRVEIDCREVPGFWQLSVTDDGPGIPQRYHEQVFLMFRTLQSRDKIESTGIGLPIVKKIVEEAGGQVFIDPAYQEGTRVVFTIRREE